MRTTYRWWERFRPVDVRDGCWEWTSSRTPAGYGLFWLDGKRVYAHRAFYERFVGPIPAGLHIDHLCRNRCCVNPSHLEPVTCRENLLRGNTAVAANTAKTHCVNGHPFSDENTFMLQGPHGTKRRCRTCSRERMNKYRRAAGVPSRPERGPYRRK